MNSQTCKFIEHFNLQLNQRAAHQVLTTDQLTSLAPSLLCCSMSSSQSPFQSNFEKRWCAGSSQGSSRHSSHQGRSKAFEWFRLFTHRWCLEDEGVGYSPDISKTISALDNNYSSYSADRSQIYRVNNGKSRDTCWHLNFNSWKRSHCWQKWLQRRLFCTASKLGCWRVHCPYAPASLTINTPQKVGMKWARIYWRTLCFTNAHQITIISKL